MIGFTIKELGDFTSTIKELSPGDTVYVDGPYGNFSMDEHHCEDIVYIAGGIGSAPVMSMLRTFADRGCKKRFTFFYGNPTWDSVIYREELAEIEEKINLNLGACVGTSTRGFGKAKRDLLMLMSSRGTSRRMSWIALSSCAVRCR